MFAKMLIDVLVRGSHQVWGDLRRPR